MNIQYYSEDIILKLRDQLNKLKGMILMDHNDEMFILEDFHIESVTHTVGFWKKREKTEFYIKFHALHKSAGMYVVT